MKICTKCGETKDFSEFVKDKSKKDGHSCHCRNCKKERHKLLRSNSLLQLEKEIRSSIQLENKILLKDGKKICSHCKQIFRIEDLQGSRCAECHKMFFRKWRKNNIEKSRENSRNYRKNNIEKSRERVKRYKEKHNTIEDIQKRREYMKQYRLKKKLEKLQQN